MALKLEPSKVAELLANPNTYATTFHVILLATLGEQFYSMDPVEIFSELESRFNCRIAEEGENRINALLTLMSSDVALQDPEAFQAVAQSLAGGEIGDAMDGLLDTLESLEVLWALYELTLNQEQEDEASPAVLRFIDEVLASENDEDGMEGVQQDLEEMKVRLHTQLASMGVAPEDLLAFIR